MKPIGVAKGPTEEKWESAFHQQELLVMGFLGGIAFTGLILVLSSPDNFQPLVFKPYEATYFYILIAFLAGTSGLCILASLALMQLAGGLVLQGSATEWFATLVQIFGLMGFGIALPMLIFPFTPTGAALVFLMEFFLFILLAFIVPRDRKKAREARNAPPQIQKEPTEP